MASGQVILRHLFGGGWATDYGPSADVVPDASGQVVIPFLTTAQNIIYELDGGPHKKPGATLLANLFSGTIASVTGLVDYWRTGSGGNPTQRRVAHYDDRVIADAGDGVFSEIIPGVTVGAVPSYCVADDLLLIADDSGNAPNSYDGTTAGALAGSPPNFAFAEWHKSRAWAAGNPAAPSRLYYSALGDPEDWIGSGSGSIDIEKDDGDVITGIASHKDQLVVFKGPKRGSIHLITGSSPTGDDAFARKPFMKGIGAVWQNSIFRYGDDLGFVTPQGSVHSLTVTAQYGDFRLGALSASINTYLSRIVTPSAMRNTWADCDPSLSIVLITLPVNGSTAANFTLMMDYRFSPPRWAYWDDQRFGCIAMAIDQADANRRKFFAGTAPGRLYKLFASERSIAETTAITYLIETPFMNYGQPFNMKTFVGGAVGIAPKNTGDFTFGWTRDDQAQQTATLDQGGAVGLDSFVLDTDTLGGARFVDRFFEEANGGEFRAIQYSISNSALGEDLEVHSISAVVDVGGVSMQN
jgi:hypothetical protein